MAIHPTTPWHKASYERFLYERLPGLLAERLPLAGYSVQPESETACRVSVTLETPSGELQLDIAGVPAPDADGLFYLDGEARVVVPTAEHEDLERAAIACVGEQLDAYVRQRLGQAPADLPWDEQIARAWLPLDNWVIGFLREISQRLDTTNWVSSHTHLRRLIVLKREKMVAPGQIGRVCPFETPEGPNIGRVFTIALGAEVSGERLVITDETPEATLGISASFLPFLENNDPNRVLMAANMLRQSIVPRLPEPAWVQTGSEPDAPGVWCGRNLLTAFVSWGEATSEDGIVLSQSAARRMQDPFPVEVGDKMANRHGAKGVVSAILPDEQMPHLPDGTPAELVFNFSGLRTRMQVGLVREALAGRIARSEGSPVVAPPFHAPVPSELKRRLERAGIRDGGMQILRDGKNGPALERPSTSGWVYWTRLAHLAQDKLRTPADEKEGEVWDEHEVIVLRRLGAHSLLQEAASTRSARSPASKELLRRVAAGEQIVDPVGTPAPAFSDLAARLEKAGIFAEVEKGGMTFRFAPPQGSQLTLARPTPHPWLHEHRLEAVGAPSQPDDPAYRGLEEANARLARMLSSSVPERLLAEAARQLENRLSAYFDALLPPEALQFSEPQAFSGRAVAAPGMGLRLDQVGLPEELCWSLFAPFVARELGGESPVRHDDPRAAQALERVMADAWVVIHNPPALAPTMLLAFHPLRDPAQVIRLNPLVCNWLNTDFDGDVISVHLPLTPGAQREAGELLSVTGHLRKDPGLIASLTPQPETLWGLAYRSLRAEGREEIAEIARVSARQLESMLTQAHVAEIAEATLKQWGTEEGLAILQELVRYGYAAARRSGASMNPFIGSEWQNPPPPESDDPAEWEAYTEELVEQILSSTDFDSLDFGPQLLDSRVRAWAWKTRSLPAMIGVRGVATDFNGKPYFVRHNQSQGLTPAEMFAIIPGARQGLARLVMQSDQLVQDAVKRSDPASLHVLSRARRAKRPGIVFARAAANGEVDPLEDFESRLLVGLQ